MDLHKLAQAAHTLLEKLQYNQTQYVSLPMSVGFAFAEIRDALFDTTPGHIGDISFRLLEMLHGAFRDEWDTGRTVNRAPPPRIRSLQMVDGYLLAAQESLSAALSWWRDNSPKDTMVALEIALLQVHRAADILGVDVAQEVQKTFERMHNEGLRRSGKMPFV